MGLFDGSDSYSFSKQFLASFKQLTEAAKTAADAYAKKVDYETSGDAYQTVVNVNYAADSSNWLQQNVQDALEYGNVMREAGRRPKDR